MCVLECCSVLECWYVVVLECVRVLLEFVGICWCVAVLVPWKPWSHWSIVRVFRSGRISSVYIVGCHTFSKIVNFVNCMLY